MPPTSATITFQGLLIFRRDPATEEFEVGILRARDAHEPHILQIEIAPDPGSGQGSLKIPPDDLERHIQNRDVRWQLEVEGSSGLGIQAVRDKPRDRRNPTAQNDRDLGWIINLEDGEFHNRPLTRARNALQPVIRLRHGSLFTSCKTDSVDTIQGQHNPRGFGFIAGGISLKIDTSEGQIPVLNFVNQKGVKVEIFRLTRTDEVSYQISIFNTPQGTSINENHFHLYYDRLFTSVPASERFDLILHNPAILPPRDRCDEGVKFSAVLTPNPFRCGGILVGEKEPLG